MRRYYHRFLEETLEIEWWKSIQERYTPMLYAQLCLTLCDPMDCSPPGSSVHGTFQVRILEWVAISSSRGYSWPRDWTPVSCISCIAGRFLKEQQDMDWNMFDCLSQTLPTVFLISTITYSSYCVSLYQDLYLLYFNTHTVRQVLLSPFYKWALSFLRWTAVMV